MRQMISARLRHNLVVLWAFVPVILIVILLGPLLRVNFNQFVPTFYDTYNDSLFHWRQIYTFNAVDFRGGYYTVNEMPAPSPFTHFYAHGPMFPVSYGMIGRMMGWRLNTPILLNALVVTLALFVTLLVVRPRRLFGLLWTGATIAVFPVLIYIPTCMSESINHAGAILLAGLCWRLITERDTMPRRWYGVLCLVLIWLALLRPTWAVLFIPVFVLRLKEFSPSRVLAAGILGMAVCVALYSVNTAISAPYPLLEQSITGGFHARFERMRANMGIWNRGIPIEVGQRYLVVGVMAGIMALWAVRRRAFNAEAIFHLTNLGSIVAINLLFNEMNAYRDFRAIAPHLLLSLIVLVACRRPLIPLLVVVVQFVMIPSFFNAYRSTIEPQFAPGLIEQINNFRDQTRDVLVYQPDAPSPWCNTLLFVMENRADRVLSIPPELALIDPGIGLSFYIGYWGDKASINFPIHSRYLLLSENNRAKIGSQARLTLLVNTDAGGVYRNEDVVCTH